MVESTFRARGYELDEHGNVHHLVYLQWFQEAAFRASQHAGYGVNDYAALGAAWVVRELDVEFISDARYGEDVSVATWISDFRKVRTHREYIARRARDNILLARGRVDWVYVDRISGAPRRAPVEIPARFEPFGDAVLTEFIAPKFSANGANFISARRVEYSEIDEMRIVNHPYYVTWLEQNMRDAFRARGDDPARLACTRHFLSFKQPARHRDVVTVSSQSFQADGVLHWAHVITREKQILVEAKSVSQ